LGRRSKGLLVILKNDLYMIHAPLIQWTVYSGQWSTG
jgi:hypothetical protein